MKKSFLKTIILSLSLIFIASSCKKYEDGPFISIRSKTERIANIWVIGKAFDNGRDVTNNYDQYELDLNNDQSASLTSNYSSGDVIFSFTTNGVWTFENNKNDLRLDFEDNDADREYEILRLKENELWLKEKGGARELQLKSK
jgi:hypothetical protein